MKQQDTTLRTTVAINGTPVQDVTESFVSVEDLRSTVGKRARDIPVIIHVGGGTWAFELANPVRKAQPITRLQTEVAQILGVEVGEVVILDVKLG